MKNSLVSIVIPVYKCEQYLDRCLNSLVNQTYQNIEIILVDDGSPDGSPALCDKWAEKNSKVKVLHKPNGGPSSARNLGIQNAKGNYVCFVDSDDEVSTEYVSKLYDALVQNDADLSICAIKSERADGTFLEEGVAENEILTTEKTDETVARIYDLGLLMTPCCKLFKKDKIKDLYPENMYYGEDEVFNLNYLFNCSKIAIIKDVMYTYYFNNASITKRKQEELFKRRAESVEVRYNLLKDLVKNEKVAGFYTSKYLIAQAYSLIKEYVKDKMKTKEITQKLEEMTSLKPVQFALDIYFPMNKQATFVCNCLKKKKFKKLIFASKIKMLIKKIIK